MEQPKRKRTRRKKDPVDYVNNKEFGEAVAEHVRGVKEDEEKGIEPRPLTDYIGLCLYKIANGLSRSPNFINYTYREDMVMDAVENCVKVINNFDITKKTRTGVPNAFSYFTQITYYAFLRRIAKEKRQTEIKQRVIDNNSIDACSQNLERMMSTQLAKASSNECAIETVFGTKITGLIKKRTSQ